MMRHSPALWLLLLAATASTPAVATESGAGHYITGTYTSPGAGIVPPQPGLYWSNVNLFYDASASPSLKLPVGGNVVSGLQATFVSVSASAIYVPRVELGPFTLAFGVTLPAQYMDSRVTLAGRSRGDTSSWFGDMVISPLIVGWHSGTNFVQARLDIFAPTGAYKKGSVANIGMNYWTFTPTLAFTHLEPALGLDLSANLGIDFNTRNDATDYQSGALLHLDVAVTKTIGESGFGVGLLGSMLYQIADDTGGLARVLGGSRGQAFAIGPVARYAFKLGQTEINASLRWAPEFAVRNRPSGNTVVLSLAGQF